GIKRYAFILEIGNRIAQGLASLWRNFQLARRIDRVCLVKWHFKCGIRVFADTSLAPKLSKHMSASAVDIVATIPITQDATSLFAIDSSATCQRQHSVGVTVR